MKSLDPANPVILFENNKKEQVHKNLLSNLRKMGLEPTRPCGHKILSLARLPIPTLPRNIDYYTKGYRMCQQQILKKFKNNDESSWNCPETPDLKAFQQKVSIDWWRKGQTFHI